MTAGRVGLKPYVGGGVPLLGPSLFSDLELYLDSRLGTSGFIDGANVSLVPDQSGHSPNRDAITFAVDPTMGRSGTNLSPRGQPTLNCRGNNDAQGLQSRGTFVVPPITASKGHTFYFYGLSEAKSTPAPYSFVNQAWFAGDPANWHFQGIANSGGGTASWSFVDDAGGGAPHRYVLSAALAGQWHLHTVVLPPPNNNTMSAVYYVDGFPVAQIGGPATYQTSIGGVSGYGFLNTLGFNIAYRGNAGWMGWYSRDHTAATVAALARWTGIIFGF